jgi:hypothetical protein
MPLFWRINLSAYPEKDVAGDVLPEVKGTTDD